MNKISITTLAAFFASLVMVNSSNAAEVNFGPFSGNLSTTVSQGFQVRASDTACELNSGAVSDYTTAQLALIGADENTGNGGCDKKMTSSYGESTKVVGIGSANSDDGRNNFAQGDFTSISSAVSFSYTGSSDEGMGITLSASGLRDSALDANEPTFKKLSSKAQDHFETNLKIGNAYVSLPMGDTDLTIGRYVQSQGVSALFPIGVNVVNPVSLPILRAPGTLLKDALLPQAMVGFNSYLGEGISLEGYYQLEQEEIELDAAGSFFGSELVGDGGNSGILNSAFYKEGTLGTPAFGAYYDVQACGNGGMPTACDATSLFGTTTDGGTQTYAFHNLISLEGGSSSAGNASLTILEQISDSVGGASIAEGMRTVKIGALSSSLGNGNAANGLAVFNAMYNGSIVPLESTITDAEFLSAYRTLAAHGTAYGKGTSGGLVDIKQAPKEKAKDSGQFGLNLSGYADNIGTGLEWGIYYNNSHSNAPRVRMLGITNMYSTSLYGVLLSQAASFDLTDDSSDPSAIVTRLFEQAVGNVAYGPTLCNTTAGGVSALFQDGTYVHNPGICYNRITVLQGLGLASHAAMLGGAVGAMATLGPLNASRYQQYYPEDIQTFGLSLATNVGPTTMNIELAYRPDYPFQIDVADLVNNMVDSTGGSLVQSTTAMPTVSAAGQPTALLMAAAATQQRWSATPLCDLSSEGNINTSVAGYSSCDGTAEFDAYTLNVNFIRSLAPSHPAVVGLGADSGSFLLDIGAVSVPDLDYKQGIVSAGHFYSGHDVNSNGCKNVLGDAVGALATVFASQSNALFGTGYCDDAKRAGASDFAVQYKLRTSVRYNNINNTQWSMSPSLGFDHGIEGNAPSSLGGWTEDSYQLSLGLGFANPNGLSISLNYTDRMGEAMQNKNNDKDTVSASLSYAF